MRAPQLCSQNSYVKTLLLTWPIRIPQKFDLVSGRLNASIPCLAPRLLTQVHTISVVSFTVFSLTAWRVYLGLLLSSHRVASLTGSHVMITLRRQCEAWNSSSPGQDYSVRNAERTDLSDRMRWMLENCCKMCCNLLSRKRFSAASLREEVDNVYFFVPFCSVKTNYYYFCRY